MNLVQPACRYLEPLAILVVDPSPFMRKVICNLLRTLGARDMRVATDVEAAVSEIRQRCPDVIMSEYFLNSANGIELARWLRRRPGDERYTPFILLTSFATYRSVMESRNAGVTEFVKKPFSAETIVARLREVVERPRPFVSTTNFFGPDRRRRSEIMGANMDRRGRQTLLIDTGDMQQSDINAAFRGLLY